MQAFCSFEELGFSDYIIELDLEYRGKTFPKEKHTYGDVSKIVFTDHQNCLPYKRQYKQFNMQFFNEVKAPENVDPSNQISEQIKKEIIYDIKELIIKTQSEEAKKVEEKYIPPKIDHKSMNIQQLVENHTHQSSDYNIQQLIKLEENLGRITNITNNNQINNNKINKVEQHIKLINDDLKQEIKEGDKKIRSIFERFINS